MCTREMYFAMFIYKHFLHCLHNQSPDFHPNHHTFQKAAIQYIKNTILYIKTIFELPVCLNFSSANTGLSSDNLMSVLG